MICKAKIFILSGVLIILILFFVSAVPDCNCLAEASTFIETDSYARVFWGEGISEREGFINFALNIKGDKDENDVEVERKLGYRIPSGDSLIGDSPGSALEILLSERESLHILGNPERSGRIRLDVGELYITMMTGADMRIVPSVPASIPGIRRGITGIFRSFKASAVGLKDRSYEFLIFTGGNEDVEDNRNPEILGSSLVISAGSARLDLLMINQGRRFGQGNAEHCISIVGDLPGGGHIGVCDSSAMSGNDPFHEHYTAAWFESNKGGALWAKLGISSSRRNYADSNGSVGAVDLHYALNGKIGPIRMEGSGSGRLHASRDDFREFSNGRLAAVYGGRLGRSSIYLYYGSYRSIEPDAGVVAESENRMYAATLKAGRLQLSYSQDKDLKKDIAAKTIFLIYTGDHSRISLKAFHPGGEGGEAVVSLSFGSPLKKGMIPGIEIGIQGGISLDPDLTEPFLVCVNTLTLTFTPENGSGMERGASLEFSGKNGRLSLIGASAGERITLTEKDWIDLGIDYERVDEIAGGAAFPNDIINIRIGISHIF